MPTRGAKAGRLIARALVELFNMLYNRSTAYRISQALIEELQRKCAKFKEK